MKKIKEILIFLFLLSPLVFSTGASSNQSLSEEKLAKKDSVPICFIDGRQISYDEMFKLRERTDSVATYMYESGRESIQNFGEKARNSIFILKSIK